jgi:hypothetical protein
MNSASATEQQEKIFFSSFDATKRHNRSPTEPEQGSAAVYNDFRLSKELQQENLLLEENTFFSA